MLDARQLEALAAVAEQGSFLAAAQALNITLAAVSLRIKSLEEAKLHLGHMDGVMVGREAYQNPGILASVDREIFGIEGIDPDPVAVVRAMYPYIERELSSGTYLGHVTRHMLGLFQGIPGARQWRRYLSENAHKAGADINVLEQALQLVADKR